MVEAVKLKHDGENWLEWCESIQKIAERKRLANYLAGTPPEPFKDVFDSLARQMVECTVPKSISNHFRHYNTARECINYLTKRFNKAHQSEQPRTEGRVGKKGKMPHGRDHEAAAATGPGKTTTDHQRTDSGSLATPASGPEVNQKVRLDLVKPHPPSPSVASTIPPKQTQPHAKESCRNGRVVVDRDDDNEDCRAHERIDDPVHGADTSTDETTAIATASASTDAAAPHHMPNTPLEGE